MPYDKKTGRTLTGEQAEREFRESRMPDSPKCKCGEWASFGGRCNRCNEKRQDALDERLRKMGAL